MTVGISLAQSSPRAPPFATAEVAIAKQNCKADRSVALLLPAINPAATPLRPPTEFALALVLPAGYRIW